MADSEVNLSGISLITPFSRVVGWHFPPSTGFMFEPTDTKEAPVGWGKPFSTKLTQEDIDGGAEGAVGDAVDLPYGTVGGDDTIKHLYWKKDKKEPDDPTKGAWEWAKKPGDQLYGNIDWIGPYRLDNLGKRDGKINKERERLSYFGPHSRYFPSHPDNFAYGSDPSHEDIYYQGRYAAVAPKPVLGACIVIEKIPKKKADGSPELDEEGVQVEEEQLWIIAVCKDEKGDIVYRRKWPSKTISKGEMDDATRQSFKALLGESTEVDDAGNTIEHIGWELLTKFPAQQDAYSPETPWFFNESGTEAKATRRFEDDFDNGEVGADGNVQEDAFYVYTLTMPTHKRADIVNNGNWSVDGSRFIFTETTTKKHVDYTDSGTEAPDGLVYTHDWKEDHLEIVCKINGRVHACFDYVGDTLLTGELLLYGSRTHKQYWTYGNDPEGYVDSSETTNISNYGDLIGPEYEQPDPYISAPADHFVSRWLGMDHYYALTWTHPIDGYQQFTFGLDINGSFSDWASGWKESDPDDPALYVTAGRNRWIHYLDMRHKVAVYFEHEYQIFWDTATQKFLTKEQIMVKEREDEALDKKETLEDNYVDLMDIDMEEQAVGGSIGFHRDRLTGDSEFDWWEAPTPYGNIDPAVPPVPNAYGRYWHVQANWTEPDPATPDVIQMPPLVETVQVITRESWTGEWSPNNDASEIIEPSARDFYGTIPVDEWPDFDKWGYKRWLKWEDYFMDTYNNYREIGAAIYDREGGTEGRLTDTNVFVSLIVYDVASGEEIPVNRFIEKDELEESEGQTDSIIGFGDKYFIIGVY